MTMSVTTTSPAITTAITTKATTATTTLTVPTTGATSCDHDQEHDQDDSYDYDGYDLTTAAPPSSLSSSQSPNLFHNARVVSRSIFFFL